MDLCVSVLFLSDAEDQCGLQRDRMNQSLLYVCVCFRCPWLSERFSVAVPIYNGIIFLFVLANFCMATFMDPGIFPRG